VGRAHAERLARRSDHGFLIAVNIFISSWHFSSTFFEIRQMHLADAGASRADKLGIDLIWTCCCVNMNRFIHPPFGFALFYLRGIADTLFKESLPEDDQDQRHLSARFLGDHAKLIGDDR
jgi:TRAP-type mannitol/chloroaromatic compound transport system permease large subunit